MYPLDDTIVAIASASGSAARGIVRVAGPAAIPIVARSFSPATATFQLEAVRVAQALDGMFQAAASASLPAIHIPVDLFVWPNAQSYTRQPAVELHAPGTPALLDAIFEQLLQNGARGAAPGEFTLRAFLSGRIDLTQAEAVLGVVDARRQSDLAVALEQLAGGLAIPLHKLRTHLLALLVEIEAQLDFADEDLDFISRDAAAEKLALARDEIASLQTQLAICRQRPAVPRAVLAGRPNAGKSSLFNALTALFGDVECGPRALVANQPGTTRDYVSTRLCIDDVAWELVDTAGTKAPAPLGDEQERLALAKNLHSELQGKAALIDEASQLIAHAQADQSDLVLHCIDATCVDATYVDAMATESQRGHEAPPKDTPGASPARSELGPTTLIVVTKIDAIDSASRRRMLRQGAFSNPDAAPEGRPPMLVSSATGEGVQSLGQAIANRFAEQSADVSPAAAVGTTARRCTESLLRAAHAVEEAERVLASHSGDDLLAAELREALSALGEVVGAVQVDDLLDGIFSQFCIGK